MARHRYFTVEEAISKEDCDTLIKIYEDTEWCDSHVVGHGDDLIQYDNLRRSKVKWLKHNSFFTRAIWSYMLEINSKHLGYILTGYEEPQLTRYTVGDYFDWHIDTLYDDSAPPRKLSAILQLSKPEDYKGGELQLWNGDLDPEKLPIMEQGSFIIVRSEEWHRITKLTEGIRYSIVFWATGPKLV